MKKNKILLLIGIVSIKVGLAQSYFNKTYPLSVSDSLNRTENYNVAIEIQGEGFLTVCNSWNFSNNNVKLVFDKIDYMGNLILQKMYGDSGDSFLPMDIHFLGDSSIGVLVDKSSYLTDTTFFYFMRVNELGDTLSTAIYSSGKTKTQPRKFISTSDSGLAMVGWAGEDASQHNSMFLIKTDINRNVEWTKEFGDTSRYNVATSILQLSDGGYFITGWVSEGTTNTYKRDAKLFRLNSYGDILWELTYGIADLFDNIEQIIKINDNNFAMIGTRCIGPNFNENADMWFLLVDSSGSVLRNKHSGGRYLEEINHFVKVNDKFYCAGIQSLVFSGYTRGYLQATNLDGDSLWSKNYVFDSTGSFVDCIWNLSTCSDGGFLLCGQASPGITGTQDAWLVKVDSNGCADTACAMSVSVSDDFLVKESTCLIYPNPSYGFSSLQIGEGFLNLETCVTIFDMNGRLISRKFMIPDRRNLLTPLIIPESGIYLVTVKSGSKEQVLKWIVMKQ
ncbi:MAG: T9SS type A sorting domain-containing protein [Bacteroidia bacterium]|nr:T9SS type A sorting domain-containing protein [Bacteroidia bacterium]